jgi:MoaA/NifB/PqqE/SkfB family radical SAM enzyme
MLRSGEGTDYVVRRSVVTSPLWRDGEPLLGRLDIELTERCNNNCLHCCINLPATDREAEARELTTDQWREVLRQAAALGALSVRFTGGEPLLREDFAELYVFARRLGMKVTLFTNARLITPELADLLVQIPPLKKVEVSVYGMRPASYNAVARAPGAFAQFRRGVGLLLERCIPLAVKSVLLPPNRDEQNEFEEWAATLPGMDGPPGYSMFLDLRGRRDSPAKNRTIRRLRLAPEEGMAIAARREAGYRGVTAEFAARFMGPRGDGLFSCGAGCGGCVDAYGTYQMCMLLRHPQTVCDLRGTPLANKGDAPAPGIRPGALQEALTSFFPRLRELRATNSDYLRRCSVCFLRGLCEQCPARSWAEHGTLDTPVEYLCEVAHSQARWLGLLGEDERAWEVRNWRARIEHISS